MSIEKEKFILFTFNNKFIGFIYSRFEFKSTQYKQFCRYSFQRLFFSSRNV